MLSGQYISALSSTMHIVCVYFFKRKHIAFEMFIILYIQPKIRAGGSVFCYFFKAKFSGNIFENCMSRVMYTGTAKALLILLLLWLGGEIKFLR